MAEIQLPETFEKHSHIFLGEGHENKNAGPGRVEDGGGFEPPKRSPVYRQRAGTLSLSVTRPPVARLRQSTKQFVMPRLAETSTPLGKLEAR